MEAWHVIFRVLKDTTRTLMPSCVFSGESAKLEAERAAAPEPAEPVQEAPADAPEPPPAALESAEDSFERPSAPPAISFEIHEDTGQFAPASRNFAHLGSGSASLRSHLLALLGPSLLLRTLTSSVM